jgi:hypothetical protein
VVDIGDVGAAVWALRRLRRRCDRLAGCAEMVTLFAVAAALGGLWAWLLSGDDGARALAATGSAVLLGATAVRSRAVARSRRANEELLALCESYREHRGHRDLETPHRRQPRGH